LDLIILANAFGINCNDNMPIHNSDIANIFEEIADLLQIDNANPFRVRAYRNAARMIHGMNQELKILVERNEELSKLPTIGKDLSAKIKETHPYIGEDIKVMGISEDIKVMGISKDNEIELTIACVFVDRYITDTNDYLRKKGKLETLIEKEVHKTINKTLKIIINSADNPETENLYLTVTGTSAESGDDGEVGRGNRVNGLITPYRPMNMEAAAGKNPVTHVGKLYNIVAQKISEALVTEINEISDAYCYLLSQIGHPINEPKIIDLKIKLHDGASIENVNLQIEDIVYYNLSTIYKIRQELITGTLQIY